MSRVVFHLLYLLVHILIAKTRTVGVTQNKRWYLFMKTRVLRSQEGGGTFDFSVFVERQRLKQVTLFLSSRRLAWGHARVATSMQQRTCLPRTTTPEGNIASMQNSPC